MNTKTSLKLALGTTFAAGIALGSAQAIADNPFAASTLESGYMQLATNHEEGKCGAMKGGEGKCGAKKDGDMKCPADTDEDGMVTKEEFMTYHEKMFDEADTDKNGSLNADERKAMHEKMMEGKCGEGKCGGKQSGDADKS